MITVNTHEAKTQLSALLAAIEEKGEVVVICRHGRPIAELRTYAPPRNVLLDNPRLGPVSFSEDPARPLPRDTRPGASR